MNILGRIDKCSDLPFDILLVFLSYVIFAYCRSLTLQASIKFQTKALILIYFS